jgi:hypothetical protein
MYSCSCPPKPRATGPDRRPQTQVRSGPFLASCKAKKKGQLFQRRLAIELHSRSGLEIRHTGPGGWARAGTSPAGRAGDYNDDIAS